MSVTTTVHTGPVLDRFLNPLLDVLTPEAAQAIADLRADAETQQRIEDFAARHHEGQLNAAELAEYDAMVSGANVIAVLQAKARSVLNHRSRRSQSCADEGAIHINEIMAEDDLKDPYLDSYQHFGNKS